MNCSKKLFSLYCLLIFAGASCGGATSDQPGQDTDEFKSFTESSGPMTIDDIVNSLPAPSSQIPQVTTSREAPFYFGRFLLMRDDEILSGTVKFRILKENDDFGYFSNVTLEYLSEVNDLATHTEIVSSTIDLVAPATFDMGENRVTITNTTDRFVSFSINFGNNDYFGDISNAGVIFSSDFTTMAGGDNENFIFIAQKVTSQPEVAESSLEGSWSLYYFNVVASLIDVLGEGDVSVGGVGGTGLTAFSGTNSLGQNFGGELTVTDETSGVFFYGLSSDGSSTASGGMDGAFLISADQNLALGYDRTNQFYFAAER